MDKIQLFNKNYVQREIPELKPGWEVLVYQKVKEGDKEKLSPFKGTVIAIKHGKEAGVTITLRKVVSGIGVEKILPLYSPTIEKIEILKKTKVRRAKLYYLREKSKKEARKKMKII